MRDIGLYGLVTTVVDNSGSAGSGLKLIGRRGWLPHFCIYSSCNNILLNEIWYVFNWFLGLYSVTSTTVTAYSDVYYTWWCKSLLTLYWRQRIKRRVPSDFCDTLYIKANVMRYFPCSQELHVICVWQFCNSEIVTVSVHWTETFVFL
jgi:hypothetical protein